MLKFTVRLLLFCSFVFLSFEVAIRIVGDHDVDGRFIFMGEELPPYRLRYSQIARNIERLHTNDPVMENIYDPDVGFVPRPSSSRIRDLHIYNAAGIRVPSIDYAYSLTPADETLRIVILGNSMSLSYGIPYEDSWGYIIEQELAAQGIQAEVLNMAVSGYNPTQMVLRWETFAREYQPDIVLWGLTLKDVRHSTYMFYHFVVNSSITPFSAPMFWVDGETSELVNMPPIPPDDLIETLQHFDESPLRPYERAYQSDDPFWYASRLLALYDRIENEGSIADIRTIPAEQIATVQYAIERMQSTMPAETTLLLLHLTDIDTLRSTAALRDEDYATVLADVFSDTPLLDTLTVFPAYDASDWQSLHYDAPAANRIGQLVAETIAACFSAETCALRILR